MGVENNEAILATGKLPQPIEELRRWVKTLTRDEQSLFAFVPSLLNSETTILLAPSGSKKGWEVDRRIAELRERFIRVLEGFNYDDGSNPFDWIEVGYGEFGQKVLRGNCKNCYSDKEYEE